jgi:hypothetical protein
VLRDGHSLDARYDALGDGRRGISRTGGPGHTAVVDRILGAAGASAMHKISDEGMNVGGSTNRHLTPVGKRGFTLAFPVVVAGRNDQKRNECRGDNRALRRRAFGRLPATNTQENNMSGMAGVVTSEVNFPPVQTISNIYSSGTWNMITTAGAEGSPFPYAFFTNATPFTIMAYVTIYDQSEDLTGVTFINGKTWVADLAASSTQGFLVTIAPGDTLWLTGDSGEQGRTIVGTFVIAHVTILPNGLKIRSVELASAKKRKKG